MKLTYFIPLFLILFSSSAIKAEKNDTIKNPMQAKDTDAVMELEVEEGSPVYTIVELMPGYPGGEEEMYKFLSNNINYPNYAKENNITGTVIVSFVIEQDGSISDARVLKDIGGGCGAEAKRVIQSMPNWIPGTQSGVPVRVQFNLPIRFSLTGGGKGCFGIF